ncbi:large ribosomal subunit protein eL20z [Physcomitrium patens]|uniref:60S ribosomal protein L18a-like protein n=1 Tax=Physcomitrium patens TaxID=3218 RepID=A0A2K1K5U7_PHYPA|nr:60S ribosomal protein L18a-like protein [Physcomitrium patens]PNR49154.1 hypothetical protein PHYPA_011050 [Physcomitrium patens]|eukprot:XP_024382079.1 60S ribosomal protein L18a-like protein [Physcomitrella patens]
MAQPGSEGYYGTFQNQQGMPQPVPPTQAPNYYPSVPGYPVGSAAEENRYRRTDDSDRLPFCGLGFGWFLFLLGFIIASVPWYVGAFIFFCLNYDHREETGLMACTIAALVFMIFGGTQVATHNLGIFQ